MNSIGEIHDIVWGPWTPVLFLLVGIVYSVRIRFFQIRKIRHWWDATIGNLLRDRKNHRESFRSACTAMAANISDGDAAGGIKNGSATVTSAVSSGKTVLTIDTLADDGYILSAGGISVTYGGKTYKAFKKADAADATFGGTGRQFVCSINDDSIDMAKVSVTVNMHKKGTADLDIVASSIRSDKGSGESYISAGLRFRGRIATDDTVSVRNVGMVIVPTAMAGETGVMP